MSAPLVLRADALAPADVDHALRTWGGFSIDISATELPWSQVLVAARDFFALPREKKVELAIEGSPHFRGWSEMHNERDWREQLHLGRERPATGSLPEYRRLDGPNLWPADPAWRRLVGEYMHGVAALGETILIAGARGAGARVVPFAGVGRDGYLVMKLIGYHPQAAATGARPGVAPHVDFSWLTLTLQDAPGLEVRAPTGDWVLIEPRPGTLWVHAGELLQFATGGRFVATPHRVINHSIERTRVSIPLFVNPPLAAHVPVLSGPRTRPTDTRPEPEHVHRVLTDEHPRVAFHFGEAEWDRKGRNHWCVSCAPH